MREIKFRGLRVDGKGWVYGDLMHFHPHHHPNLTIIEGGCIYYEIKPETVGQYMGYNDKNGVEIYEEDVVRADYGYGHPSPIPVNFESFIYWAGENCISDDIEVIGNIHENPELLGVK